MRAVARKGGAARSGRVFTLCAWRRIAAKAAPTGPPARCRRVGASSEGARRKSTANSDIANLQLETCKLFYRCLLALASFVGAVLAAMRAVARKGGAARSGRVFTLCAWRRIAAEAAPTGPPARCRRVGASSEGARRKSTANSDIANLQLETCKLFYRCLLALASFVGAVLAAMRAVARKGGAARPGRVFALCAWRRIAAEAAPTGPPAGYRRVGASSEGARHDFNNQQ